MKLYEIAQEIATEDYVAQKIAEQQLAIVGYEIALMVTLGIAVVVGVVAILSRRIEAYEVQANLRTALICIAVAAFAAITVEAVMIGVSHNELAAWETDPIAKTIVNLADAI